MMVKVVFHMAQDVLYHSGLPTKGRGRALEMLWCKSKSKFNAVSLSRYLISSPSDLIKTGLGEAKSLVR
jgi:hypothetical protein